MKEDVLHTIKPTRKFKKSWIIFVFCVILCGWGIYEYQKPKEKIISYVTIMPTRGDIANKISATGTLYPLNEVQIGSQVSGMIDAIYVDSNDEVKKGQILAKIDDQKILQELEAKKAQLQGAKAQLLSLQSTLKDKQWQFERLQKLHKQSKGKYPSFADVQNAQVAYDVAKAEVLNKKAFIQEIEIGIKSSQIDYDNTIITSPIDGIVLVRSVDVGQTVAASFSAPELFKIAQNLEEMKLVVKIAESDIGKIAIGQQVEFSVDAYPQKTFNATVNKINYGSSVVDNIVSYEVTILVKNQDLLLRPGMSANVDICIQEAKDVLLLPLEAIYFLPKEQRLMQKTSLKTSKDSHSKNIWVLINGEPREQTIQTGITDGKMIEVLDGIYGQTNVILEEKND